jgi:hypothetical protein
MNDYGDFERRKDFDFFLNNYNELYNKYGHKFIAVKNQNVLGSYDTEIEAINDIEKQYPLGSFIVQECNGDESGYTNYISSWQIVSM